MQNEISPEEKLLNLIKGGGGDSKDTLSSKKESREVVQKPTQPPKGIASVPKKVKPKGIKFLLILNRLLIISMITAIIYMIFGYMHSYRSNVQIPEKVELKPGEGLEQQPTKTPLLVSYYTDVLAKRQMFKLYEVPKLKPTGPPKPKVSIQQLISGYTFVGILFGDVPQAIVEDKKTGQSFYLTAGQSLGEIKIEKIEKGRVTVSYEGETMNISI